MLTQAAFKQVPRSPGGHSSTDSTKWDSTKVEDKTLLHQAGPPKNKKNHVTLTSGHRHLSYLHQLAYVMSHIPTMRHESMLCSHLVGKRGTCNEDHRGTECWTSRQNASVVQQMPGFAPWIASKGICVDARLALS